MKKSLAVLAVLSSAAMAASASASLLVADGFNYTAGTALGGNTDTDFPTNPATWAQIGTGANGSTPKVVSGNLVYPGPNALPSLPGSNSVQGAKDAGAARIQLATPATAGVFSDANPPASGSLYYSFTMQANDLSYLTTGTAGGFIAGFNNSVGTGSSISTAAGVLCVRKDSTTGNLQLGIAQNQTPTSDRTFNTTTEFSTNDILFVVAGYHFNGAGADTADLWVYDGTTNDAIPVSQPASTFASSPWGADVNNIESFFFRDNTSAITATFDDVRVGTTWADVTSVPEPASLGLVGLAASAVLGRRRKIAKF